MNNILSSRSIKGEGTQMFGIFVIALRKLGNFIKYVYYKILNNVI